MAGVKGKSGRRRLSAEQHIVRGTFRPDRHGPRPMAIVVGAAVPQSTVQPIPKTVIAGLSARGRTLVLDLWDRFDGWSPAHLVVLHEVGAVADSLAEYETIIRRDGCLVKSSRGNQIPHALLRVQATAHRTLALLFTKLDLEGK